MPKLSSSSACGGNHGEVCPRGFVALKPRSEHDGTVPSQPESWIVTHQCHSELHPVCVTICPEPISGPFPFSLWALNREETHCLPLRCILNIQQKGPGTSGQGRTVRVELPSLFAVDFLYLSHHRVAFLAFFFKSDSNMYLCSVFVCENKGSLNSRERQVWILLCLGEQHSDPGQTAPALWASFSLPKEWEYVYFSYKMTLTVHSVCLLTCLFLYTCMGGGDVPWVRLGGQRTTWRGKCLSQGFYSCTKHHDQEASWEGKGLSSLHFHMAVHHQRKTGLELTRVRKQELMQRPWKDVTHWLASPGLFSLLL